MPWYSSWIPTLPNFVIPTSIQGRFLSFVLKKSLGNFVKPGQLDHHQIDSQIGSGYVQVNDLVLHPEAINEYLDGLPVALHSGTVSSIKARIPWPNPLASTLGFSLKSVHLTFHVVSAISHTDNGGADLSSSVTSVAESFVHEELSAGEEANLWKSLHEEAITQSSLLDNQVFPGDLGPTPGRGESSTKSETDPVGVSVFAGLIERLLARFEFDARDIKITLIHPGNVTVSLELEEIKYLTNNALSNPTERGESRSLSLGGISISCRNLSSSDIAPMAGSIDITYPQTASPGEINPPSLSRISSRSSMGEEAQFDMSQSILALPPRSASPVDSVSSSMYESAISTTSSSLRSSNVNSTIDVPSSGHLPESPETVLQQASTPTIGSTDVDWPLLTFGSQPIVIRLTTPSPVASEVSDEDPFIPSAEPTEAGVDELEISVSLGIMACLVRPWQIRSLSQLATSLSSGSTRSENEQAMELPQIKIDARMRGAVALLYPSVADHKVPGKDFIADFFNKPLVPPTLESNYTRIYLDNISALLRVSNEFQEPLLRREKKSQTAQVKYLDARVEDLSIFYFRKDPDYGNNEPLPRFAAFPIILTDPHLILQYPRSVKHPHSEHNYPPLPTFDVIDWTDERCKTYGARLSQWRCQQPKYGVSSNRKASSEITIPHPFMKISASRTCVVRGSEIIQISENLETNMAPLNIRIDIQYLLEPGGLLSFFEDILLLETPICDRDSLSSEDTVDMYSSTRNVRARKGVSESPQFEKAKGKSQGKQENSTNIEVNRVVNFPFTRIAVKCPPPQSIDRSGTLIFDIHDLILFMNPSSTNKAVNFAIDDANPYRNVEAIEDNVMCMVKFDRAVMACSMVKSTTAVALASIGSLTDEEEYTRNENESRPDTPKPSAFKPRVSVIQPSSKVSSKTPVFALSIDIPGVHVDISKQILDALQYWADDVSQLLERLSKSPNLDKDSNPMMDSKNTSLIGSIFFVNSRSGSGSLTPTESAESVVKLSVTEAFVRIMVPRSDSTQHIVRPFDIRAADLDVLIELNPDDKQQTVITMGVMDLSIKNTDPLGKIQNFFSLSSPYSLSSTPKPIVKLRFTTSIIPGINSKETRIKLTLCNFTYSFFPDLHWISDLAAFAKNPPGTFESVIPSDRTRIFVKIIDASIQTLAPVIPASIVSHINELEFSTDVVGDSRDSSFQVQATDTLSLLVLDDIRTQEPLVNTYRGRMLWMASGYALLAEVVNLDMKIVNQVSTLPLWKVAITHVILRLHLCADTMTAVTAFIQDFGALFKSPEEVHETSTRNPAVFNKKVVKEGNTLMSSVEDLAFKRIPEIGPAPDMIYDDLPTNMDYLDESFGAAAGLREFCDDDLEDFDNNDIIDGTTSEDDPYIISKVGGETVKVFEPQGLEVVEDYFQTIPPDRSQGSTYDAKPLFNLKIDDGNFTLFLYDGYDWAKTRKTIEEEVKEMRKRLAKIRQLVSSGQTQDPVIEDTSAFLFNSVHIGLDQDDDVLKEPSVLIAAIDEELKEDDDTASQSSWQSLRPTISSSKPKHRSNRVYGRRLTRSKAPSMEFCFMGMHAEFDQYEQDDPLVSRTFVTVRDLEILDHIKTSTWKKFLTELRSDSRGNVRETDSNMVRIELQNVRPVSGNASEESRLRAKILPLRLYVDQDAVDFLKKFFSFKDPHSQPSTESAEGNEAYIQLAEIFPIDLKLDYKPRRVDYRALKEGRTIELMNFFHFDGAEMTLRHITLSGVTGWPKMFEMLNDLWTPDVKATQLAEVISGVAPIRSVVNVGSGVADLILLPIAQYKKDGRIVRGIQKGATAFVRSTAVEAIKMGAKLATGTQVILEQAEGILGGQLDTITAEPVQVSSPKDFDFEEDNDNDDADLISKYAQQPADLKEGVQFAYKSLQKNLSSAAQTILAVPMEVYERSGNEGPVRSVIRAVPIAVLKPMIGASEAVSKTLLGLHNTLDPNVRHENDAKYKLR